MATRDKLPARRSRILIVDDHPVVRLGLNQLLAAENDLEVSGEVSSSMAALKILDAQKFDLALIDISLEDGSGIDLIKQIRSRHESLRILVLSMHDEKLFAQRALHAGALGYVSKHEVAEKLVGAIRRVLQGKVFLSESMTDRLLEAGITKKPVTDPSPAAVLSDRELEVLEMISRGLATREIARDLRLSVKTIETHRENVKKKLHLQTNFELVRYAIEWANGRQ